MFGKIDFLGIAAVIGATSTFVTVLGGTIIQLRTLKATQAVRTEQKVMHKAVNSNMEAALTEIKRLNNEAAEKAEEKAAEDVARAEEVNPSVD